MNQLEDKKQSLTNKIFAIGILLLLALGAFVIGLAVIPEKIWILIGLIALFAMIAGCGAAILYIVYLVRVRK